MLGPYDSRRTPVGWAARNDRRANFTAVRVPGIERRVTHPRALSLLLIGLATSCATQPPPKPTAAATETPAPPRPEPFPVAFVPAEPADAPRPPAPAAVLLRGGTVMTAAGRTFAPGHVLVVDGSIASVGEGPGVAPEGARVVDATGRFLTPGLIDSHSHMGVYPIPGSSGNSDGNEVGDPTTSGVWAEHGFWPQDPALPRAVAGGITTIQVLPGSANLIGGRSFTAKLKLKGSAREMRFPGAPQGLKMACGENPKRVYGEHRNGLPSTRMGNVFGYRKAFQDALEYRRRWLKYERDLSLWRDRLERERLHPTTPTAPAEGNKPAEPPGPLDPPDPPGRDLEHETLAKVLDGTILVHNHCYRADEMNLMLDLAKQYHFKIRSFHHALEAYKLRDRLASEGVAVSTWADWWGFKMEGLDGIPENAPLVAAAGARAIIHSDSGSEVRHLNQEAAKALAAGKRLGLVLDDNEALRWITANPAWALGVEEKTGTLTVGKMGDVVVWDRHPFSVYAKAAQVYIDGELVFDRGTARQVTDFEVTLPHSGDTAPAAGVLP
ncbi:MAG: amidohydrolase [Deltaproteobacteria bacterium]|nr:amidohydrolase [Deltaproteobacteria bacterium]